MSICKHFVESTRHVSLSTEETLNKQGDIHARSSQVINVCCLYHGGFCYAHFPSSLNDIKYIYSLGGWQMMLANYSSFSRFSRWKLSKTSQQLKRSHVQAVQFNRIIPNVHDIVSWLKYLYDSARKYHAWQITKQLRLDSLQQSNLSCENNAHDISSSGMCAEHFDMNMICY